MIQYATEEEFAIYGLPSAAYPNIASETVLAHIGAASAKANSYIPSRYSPPLTAWGTDLTEAVCHIAAWTLLSHVRGASPDDPAMMAIMKSHDDAITWLRDVAAGKAHLDIVETAPSAIAAPRIVTREKRGSWR